MDTAVVDSLKKQLIDRGFEQTRGFGPFQSYAREFKHDVFLHVAQEDAVFELLINNSWQESTCIIAWTNDVDSLLRLIDTLIPALLLINTPTFRPFAENDPTNTWKQIANTPRS